MDTYKIGNKVKLIIRSFSAGKMGDMDMEYENQPYTIVNGASLNLSFDSVDKTSNRGDINLLTFNHDRLTRIDISDVPLTEKILKLIYKNNGQPLCCTSENLVSDGNILYLNIPDTIYQVFLYDNEGNLEKAYGEYTESTMEVEKTDSSYMLIYSYMGEKSISLDKPNNFYCILDAQIEGNINDQTSKMFLHCGKCGVKVNKDMAFRQHSNTVDLSFIVLDKENYLTIK